MVLAAYLFMHDRMIAVNTSGRRIVNSALVYNNYPIAAYIWLILVAMSLLYAAL